MIINSILVANWLIGEKVLVKDNIYKIRNHAGLIIVYNHPTSLHQDQSVAIATTNFE